jgi:hypothetical protein
MQSLTLQRPVAAIHKLYIYIYAGPGGRAFGVGLGRLVTGIVGSNSSRGMDVCLCVSVLCCPV